MTLKTIIREFILTELKPTENNYYITPIHF